MSVKSSKKILKNPACIFCGFFWLYEKASTKTISKALFYQKAAVRLLKKLDFY